MNAAHLEWLIAQLESLDNQGQQPKDEVMRRLKIPPSKMDWVGSGLGYSSFAYREPTGTLAVCIDCPGTFPEDANMVQSITLVDLRTDRHLSNWRVKAE